jgi:hypothetical protein
MIQNKKTKIEAIREQAYINELQDCTFKPLRASVSNPKLAAKKNRMKKTKD